MTTCFGKSRVNKMVGLTGLGRSKTNNEYVRVSRQDSFDGSFSNPVFMSETADRPNGGYETPSECHIYYTIPDIYAEPIQNLPRINQYPNGRYVSDNKERNATVNPPKLPSSSANRPKSYTKTGKRLRTSDTSTVRVSLTSNASTVRSSIPLTTPRNSLAFGKSSTKWGKFTFIAVVSLLVCSLATALVIYFTVFYKQHPSSNLSTQKSFTTTLQGSIEIISGKYSVFTNQLNDPNSSLYEELAEEFGNQMSEILSKSRAKDVYNYTEILEFSPGSVIVSYRLHLNSPVIISNEEKAVDSISTYYIKNIIKSDIKVVPDGRAFWGNFIINPHGFTFNNDAKTSQQSTAGSVNVTPSSLLTSLTTRVSGNTQTSSPTGPQCSHAITEECSSVLLYNSTSESLSSQQNHNILPYIQQLHTCSEHARFLFCARAAPKCDNNGDILLPCRHYCEDLKSNCRTVLETMTGTTDLLQCENLPDSRSGVQCLHPSKVPTSTTSPATIVTTPSTTPAPRCKEISIEFCQEMPWNATTFPNFMDHRNQMEANFEVSIISLLHVSQTCYANLNVYGCAILVPKCDDNVQRIPPCRRLCQDAKDGCESQLQKYNVDVPFDCDTFPDSDDPKICVQAPPVPSTQQPGTVSPCAADAFNCGNGECRPMRDRCDGTNDCSNFADELNCDTVSCRTDQFKCDSGECRPLLWKCDNTNDCADGSDEADCNSEAPCTTGQFRCKGGGFNAWNVTHENPCIKMAWICDGNSDCTDDTDEIAYMCEERRMTTLRPAS